MVKPSAPTIDPGSTAGNNRPEYEGVLGYFPVWSLMDLNCCSEFAYFVAVFITCCSKVMSFVFGHFSGVFAAPRTEFSAQHALKGAGLYLGD